MSGRWLTEAQVEAHQRKLGKVSLVTLAAKASLAPAKLATRSDLEQELQRHLEDSDLPPAQFDVPYLVGSRHRLDVCWPALKFGVEVQGLQHGIKGRFKQDIRKRVFGQLQGWLVVEVDGESIRNGDALRWIQQLIKKRVQKGENWTPL
jgi:very-short-patch-repair endonuclease